MQNFSVLMSVYKNDNPEHFAEAVDSIINQTLLPDEFIIIRDGQVPDALQKKIDSYINQHEKLFTYIPLEKNSGLGKALALGVSKAKNDIIVRMDSDDISLPNRFELELAFLEENPEIAVVGGQIIEFEGDLQNVLGKRCVPQNDSDIKAFIKSRNPFNHMTVAFRKHEVLQAGNYQDFHYLEDYFLWLRMMLNGCSFANLEQTLVFARTGKDMYKRRGGYTYFKSFKKLEHFKFKNNIITFSQYIFTLSVRFILQVLMPNNLRGAVFKLFARTKAEK